MRMGQKDGVNGVRPDVEGDPVAVSEHLVALEQPAVHEDAFPGCLNQVPGTGHAVRGSEEPELRVSVFHNAPCSRRAACPLPSGGSGSARARQAHGLQRAGMRSRDVRPSFRFFRQPT
ncbi:hypothetical protein D9M72_634080 [compost metagenome]